MAPQPGPFFLIRNISERDGLTPWAPTSAWIAGSVNSPPHHRPPGYSLYEEVRSERVALYSSLPRLPGSEFILGLQCESPENSVGDFREFSAPKEYDC